MASVLALMKEAEEAKQHKLTRKEERDILKDTPFLKDLPKDLQIEAMEFLRRPVGRPPATPRQQLKAVEKKKIRNRMVARRDKALIDGDVKKYNEIQNELFSYGIIGKSAFENSNIRFMERFMKQLQKLPSQAERNEVLRDVLDDAFESVSKDVAETAMREAMGEVEVEEEAKPPVPPPSRRERLRRVLSMGEEEKEKQKEVRFQEQLKKDEESEIKPETKSMKLSKKDLPTRMSEAQEYLRRKQLYPTSGGGKLKASSSKGEITRTRTKRPPLSSMGRASIEKQTPEIPNRNPPPRPSQRDRLISQLNKLRREGDNEYADSLEQMGITMGVIDNRVEEVSEQDIEDFVNTAEPNQLRDHYSVYNTSDSQFIDNADMEESDDDEGFEQLQQAFSGLSVRPPTQNSFSTNYSAGGGVGAGEINQLRDEQNQIEQPSVWSNNEFLVSSQINNNALNRQLYEGVDPNTIQGNAGMEYFNHLNNVVLVEDRQELYHARDRLNVLTGGNRDSLFSATDLASTKRRNIEDEGKYNMETITDNENAPAGLQRGMEQYGYNEIELDDMTLANDGYISTPLGVIENIRGLQGNEALVMGRSNNDIMTNINDVIRLAGKRGLYAQDKSLAQEDNLYEGYDVNERFESMNQSAQRRNVSLGKNDPYLMTYDDGRQVEGALSAGMGRPQGASLKELRAREFDYKTPNRSIRHDGYKFFRGGASTFQKIQSEFDP